MERKTGKRGQLMGGLFTMLLFLVFILSALFTVLTGSRVYENITARSDKNFSSSTALSYIANKVRQGDRAGMTDIKEIEGTQVLEMCIRDRSGTCSRNGSWYGGENGLYLCKSCGR